mmetsp:Transcript_14800/g.22613  ORF Transcript_14800/g.22613 Transcript_14800/m.22613 type:complete len:105 (-) Transcript_14800:324-638(-)
MLTIDEDICIMIPSTTIWNLLLLFGLSLSPCASSEIYDSNERPLGAVTADSMDENHRVRFHRILNLRFQTVNGLFHSMYRDWMKLLDPVHGQNVKASNSKNAKQ